MPDCIGAMGSRALPLATEIDATTEMLFNQAFRTTPTASLPDTIKAPSIVLQHSMKSPVDGSPDIVQRYDYLKPEEMAAEMSSADRARVPVAAAA